MLQSPSESFDEQATWSLIRQGDKQAFLQLYEQFFHYLLSIGIRITNDPDAAKDACQEYFMYLWEKRNSLSEVRNLKGYLYRGYKNQLTKMLLKGRLTAVASFETGMETDEHWTQSPETEFIHAEDVNKQQGELVKAFKNLPERQRELLYLRYYALLSHTAIAERTGLSIRSVYNQIHIAQNRIKTALSKGVNKNMRFFFFLFF
jgi:RNA polymerase sigma factor (sigma-70 family)